MKVHALALLLLLLRGATLVGQEILRDVPPQVAKAVTARYTDAARAEGIEGTVVLRVLVREDGSVDPDIEIVRSLDQKFGLDEQAIIATRQWQFRPARNDGEPTARHVTVEQTFKLPRQ